ncbi:hypothetical protein CO112_00365, partial [Candidatus Dojkabacteria bacterium CG_4_9_14_3_um_filter_150_Dojkabacteria_WS6_41_13]
SGHAGDHRATVFLALCPVHYGWSLADVGGAGEYSCVDTLKDVTIPLQQVIYEKYYLDMVTKYTFKEYRKHTV